jgi:hypothetical protein
MAQNLLYVLFGHGQPLQKGNLIHVPDNGTMIKMIPGTCTPEDTLQLTQHIMRYPNTPPAEFVKLLNGIGPWKSMGIDKMNHPAFTIYEPGSIYSDSQIVNEEHTKLFHYKFDDKAVSTYNITDLLHEHIQKKPIANAEFFPLSSVNEYIARLHPSLNYTLIVLACMSIDKDMDAWVYDQLRSGLPIETVHERLKTTFRYHGGKKGRMNQKTIRKKRQNCKKKLSTKKTRKSHRK